MYLRNSSAGVKFTDYLKGSLWSGAKNTRYCIFMVNLTSLVTTKIIRGSHFSVLIRLDPYKRNYLKFGNISILNLGHGLR